MPARISSTANITPPEHLQMGMVGQLYVRPRQNKATGDLYAALTASNTVHGLSSDGLHCADILCTGATPAPAAGDTGASRDITPAAPGSAAAVSGLTSAVNYAYNDGDGTTAYDVEYPIQMMGFDPAFHFVGMTFNPEDFSGMKDKYFMLSGRSYPDTINTAMIRTQSSDGLARPSPGGTFEDHAAVLHLAVRSGCHASCAAAGLGLERYRVPYFGEQHSDDGHRFTTRACCATWPATISTTTRTRSPWVAASRQTSSSSRMTFPRVRTSFTPPISITCRNDAENVGGMMTEIEIL